MLRLRCVKGKRGKVSWHISILFKENVILYFFFRSFFPLSSSFVEIAIMGRGDEGKGKEKEGKEETKSRYYSVGCTRLPASELNNRSSDDGRELLFNSLKLYA